jgi:hypothetical protein
MGYRLGECWGILAIVELTLYKRVSLCRRQVELILYARFERLAVNRQANLQALLGFFFVG